MKKRITILAAVCVALAVAGHVVWEWPREISGVVTYGGYPAVGHVTLTSGAEVYEVNVQNGNFRTVVPSGTYRVKTWVLIRNSNLKTTITEITVVPWQKYYNMEF